MHREPISKHWDAGKKAVKLTQRDQLELFDPVIRQIIGLVSEQAADVKHKVDRIVLVGGLGGSRYLYKTLKQWCTENGNIMLICPEFSQKAVALGAVLRGLTGSAPSHRRLRHHYGFTYGIDFRAGIDSDDFSSWIEGKKVRGTSISYE